MISGWTQRAKCRLFLISTMPFTMSILNTAVSSPVKEMTSWSGSWSTIHSFHLNENDRTMGWGCEAYYLVRKHAAGVYIWKELKNNDISKIFTWKSNVIFTHRWVESHKSTLIHSWIATAGTPRENAPFLKLQTRTVVQNLLMLMNTDATKSSYGRSKSIPNTLFTFHVFIGPLYLESFCNFSWN